MIEIAGGRWKPFWTGVVIDDQTKLAGTVNGTYYEGIGFFGAAAYGRGVRPNFPEIFWYPDFGPLTAATNIYFHNLFYVSAKNDLFKTYTPGWPQMFCMCEGKTETDAYVFRTFSRRSCQPLLDQTRQRFFCKFVRKWVCGSEETRNIAGSNAEK